MSETWSTKANTLQRTEIRYARLNMEYHIAFKIHIHIWHHTKEMHHSQAITWTNAGILLIAPPSEETSLKHPFTTTTWCTIDKTFQADEMWRDISDVINVLSKIKIHISRKDFSHPTALHLCCPEESTLLYDQCSSKRNDSASCPSNTLLEEREERFGQTKSLCR